MTLSLFIQCNFWSASFVYLLIFLMKLLSVAQVICFHGCSCFLAFSSQYFFLYMSQSVPILYLRVKQVPKIGVCFSFVHLSKLFTKYWSSMFNYDGAIPIGPNVALLAVFTFKGFWIMFPLSELLLNICCDMHKHVAPVSNRTVIGSVLRILMPKFV